MERKTVLHNDDSEVPGTSFQFEEAGRGCRNKRKQNDPTCCPVCGLTLRQSEVDGHLHCEIEKLKKILCPKNKSNSKSSCSSTNGSNNQSDRKWSTYQKVRLNRQTRQKTKKKKRQVEGTCPICNEEVTEDITMHVELCLKRSEANDSDSSDENIDVENNFEEYEWAGQTRVRATTLVEGSLSTMGTSISMADGDEYLNVDGDDGQMYGSPQYSETDVILPCEDPENFALRKAVAGSSPRTLGGKSNTNDVEFYDSLESNGGDPTVEVLKNKIKEMERNQNEEEVYKCLICMERYKTPVISICCWHVHCEKCWLQTLGVKKLCPQCNSITSPTDLRKIYM